MKIDEIQLQTININKHINFLRSNRTQFKNICHRKINGILFPLIKKIISVTQSIVRKVIIWSQNSIRKALECAFSLLHLWRAFSSRDAGSTQSLGDCSAQWLSSNSLEPRSPHSGHGVTRCAQVFILTVSKKHRSFFPYKRNYDFTRNGKI